MDKKGEEWVTNAKILTSLNPDCLLKVLGSFLELSWWLDDERIVMI